MSHLSKQTKVVGSACNTSTSRARSQEKMLQSHTCTSKKGQGGIHVINQQIELRANKEMHKQNQERKHMKE